MGYREPPELVLGGGVGPTGRVQMPLGPLGVAVGAGATQEPPSSSSLEHAPESEGWPMLGLLGLLGVALCAAAVWLVSVQARTKSTSEAATNAERSTKRVALLAGCPP